MRSRLVNLEYSHFRRNLRPALGEGVQAGSQDHVLADVLSMLYNQILDEAGTRHDGGAEKPGALRVHVRPAAPAILRRRQLETNFVLKHVRRRIDLDVQGPP